MRIALVHPRLDHRGGAENIVCWMARGLRERGHEVVVATQRFAPERWDEKDWDGRPPAVLEPGILDRFQTRAARKRGVGRALRRALGACELIVAHNAPAPLWSTAAAQRMHGARVVWFCEEPRAQYHWRQSSPALAAAAERPDGYPWLREALAPLLEDDRRRARSREHAIDLALDREAAARVDQILANSAFTAQGVERVYGRRAAPCLLGQPRPDPVVRASAPRYVAWITSANPAKNALGFLEAIRIAVRERGAADLRVEAVGLAGEGWERRVAELGIADVVHRCERLSDAALNELVARSQLLACPPIDEPFGLTCLHAMAHGRAVLASSIGGPSETVVDGVTGLHADPLDPAAIADRLCELWASPARCEALGAAGRERFEAEFTFERFLDRFEARAFGAASAERYSSRTASEAPIA